MSINPKDRINPEVRHQDSLAASRRELFKGGSMLMAAAVVATPLVAGCARAEDNPPAKPAEASTGTSLYDRLGGIFAIAAVVDFFSDEVVKDPVAGAGSKNPQLRNWHTESLDRLPGLKWMRTLWVAKVAGGPYDYTPTVPGSTNLGLEEAHRKLKISSEEFDAVAGVLSRSLDRFKVPEKEKAEVLAAFAAHKAEVIQGSRKAS